MNDIRLSVSKTKTFIDCKKKYHYSYVIKLPKKEMDYHIFGKFCHKVLEDFHNFYIAGTTDPLNIAMKKAYANAMAEFSEKMTKEMKKECYDIILNYLKLVGEDKNNNVSANVLACEKQFEVPIELPNNGQLVLNGMIDRVQLDNDGILHVCDYKTTKNKKYLKNDFFQLLTYAYVLLKDNPEIKKVRGSYILLRHNFEYITQEFEVPEIMEVENKYIKYATEILSETEFPPNPQILCRYCDFVESCDSGRKMLEPNKVFGEVSW